MRKNSKSLRKSSPQKQLKKKDCSKRCLKKQITPLNFQNSLYRKYSHTQNFYYISDLNKFITGNKQLTLNEKEQTDECLEKYYKSLNRKHIFPKIKQVYKMHKQIPRIFQPEIKQILNKCHHRKRLLEYFKIAKVLGIKVESIKLSTFLLSVNDITNKKMQPDKHYDRIISKISSIDFSTDAERNLLEEFLIHERQTGLSNRQNCSSFSNLQFRD